MLAIYLPLDLDHHRNELVKQTIELRKHEHTRLRTPLFVTEKYLQEVISISREMELHSRIQVHEYLEDCENLIDGIALWYTQDSDTSWAELRSLLEEFALQLIESDFFDILFVKSEKTSVRPLAFNENGFAVMYLKENHIDNPRYWCQIAHEISHLNQDFQKVRFTPHLPESKNNERYQMATKVWFGAIEPNKAWFTEVLADLWSCQTVGAGYSIGFDNYRESIDTDNPTVGTRSHPPSDLRVALMAIILTKLGYSDKLIPEYTPLDSLLPTLTMDDSEYDGEINNLKEIFDLTIIKEVERISFEYLDDCPDHTSVFLRNFNEIVTNSILMKHDLVTDIGVLAMFHDTSNEAITQYIDELKEEYT